MGRHLSTNTLKSKTMNTTETSAASRLEGALAVILPMHAAGDTPRYIARALDIRKVPYLTDRARSWEPKTVWRLIQKHAPAR